MYKAGFVHANRPIQLPDGNVPDHNLCPVQKQRFSKQVQKNISIEMSGEVVCSWMRLLLSPSTNLNTEKIKTVSHLNLW